MLHSLDRHDMTPEELEAAKQALEASLKISNKSSNQLLSTLSPRSLLKLEVALDILQLECKEWIYKKV